MKDWIRAYWNYRLELAKQKRIVKVELDWFGILLWLTVFYLAFKEVL